jgi:nucleoside-diphosphate kinase
MICLTNRARNSGEIPEFDLFVIGEPGFVNVLTFMSSNVKSASLIETTKKQLENIMERTFAIIKPDAFAAGNAGKILARIYAEGFSVVGIKKLYMSKVEAEGFYYVHRERPFFGELTDFMSSGPCIVMVLEAEGAIAKWRDLMGATNPAEAAKGTMRKEFGASIGENATHGSDAPETAAFEIPFFFNKISTRKFLSQ